MSLPYFPLYPDDFEADTAHLTLAEDGAYNRLLRLCWRTPGCSLPSDREWVYRRMRARTDEEKAVVDIVLDEFFEAKNGRLSNARIAREYEQASEANKRRKNAGSKGGKAKALKTKETEPSNAQAMLKQCSSNQNQNQNQSNTEDTSVSSAASGADFVDATSDAIWRRGVPFLTEQGVPEKNARSFIGKALRDHGSQAVFEALADAKKVGTGDPIPYITEILKPAPDLEKIISAAVKRISNAQ